MMVLSETRDVRIVREGPDEAVVKKLLRAATGDESSQRLQLEWNFSREAHAHVRQAMGMVQEAGAPALKLAYVPGKTWAEAMQGKALDWDYVLPLAHAAVLALARLHESGIVHGSISPGHIILREPDGHVVFISMRRAWRADEPHNISGDPWADLRPEDLAYLAPEQSGRTNQAPGPAADLYALGVMLYEAFTGLPPFTDAEPFELIHAHLAKAPVPLDTLRPELPEALVRIVHTLLEKEPGARYASAAELLSDIESCIAQWKASGNLERCILPQQRLRKLIASEGYLFGRAAERGQLTACFDRVRAGSWEWVWIAGASGAGKSALAQSLRPEVAAAGGFFIEGKFDAARRSAPYAALSAAVRRWVTQALTLDESALQYWKNQLAEKLGPARRVLADLVPEFKWITGELPELPPLEGQEAQNRIRFALGQFALTLASEQHPVVLLLEDIQWADADTAALLETMSGDRRFAHLLVISTQRAETTALPPEVLRIRRQLLQGALPFTDIALGALSQADVLEMLHDTLGAPLADETKLAAQLLLRTQGNAQYLRQVIAMLLRRQALHYEPSAGLWQWKPEDVDLANRSGDIPELIGAQVAQLPAVTRRLLTSAACVGSHFDAGLLGALHDASPVVVRHRLMPALSEGMIAADPDAEQAYFFVHDNIREAALRQLDAAQEEHLHYQIGCAMLERYPDAQQEQHVFDIVYQLDRGKNYLDDPARKEELARLNLKAGLRARETGAFQTAYERAESGINMLAERPWEQQYELSLGLHQLAVSAAALVGEYDILETLSATALANARNLLDQEPVIRYKVQANIARKNMGEALKIGLAFLEKFGFHFPENPNTLHVIRGLLTTRLRLAGKTPESLSRLPVNTNPEVLAALRVMTECNTAAYFGAPNLLPLLLFKAIELNLKHGNSPYSAFAYDGYGFILAGVLGQYGPALEFGRLAVQVASEPGHESRAVVRNFIHNVFIRHWTEPTRDIMNTMDGLFDGFRNTGDFENAAYAAQTYLYFAFYLGQNLQALAERAESYTQNVSQMNQPGTLQRIAMYHQASLNLLGLSDDPVKLNGEAYNEDIMLPVHHQDNLPLALHNVYFLKTFLSYLFGEYEAAAVLAAETRRHESGATSSYFIPLFAWLESLCLLASPDAKKHLRRVDKNLGKMKSWAKSAPANYLRHYSLVRAERARVAGDTEAAQRLYDEAIQQARAERALLDEALAWELKGKCTQAQPHTVTAAMCFQQAFACYHRWGAVAKTRHLQSHYGVQVEQAAPTGPRLLSADTIDMNSMFRLLQSISTEIELPLLLDSIMDIMVKHAGASRGLIIMNRQGAWEALAEREVNNRKVTLRKAQILETAAGDAGSDLVPEGIIQYVIRTQETLVINDVAADGRFANLPYLQTRRPQSLLALPLIKQSRLVGVLYLENTLTPGAFSARIQEGLRMMAGQLATSLENALLYEDLEDKVRHNRQLLGELKGKVEEQERTLRIFARFVPESVVRKTLESPESKLWEGEQRNVSVIFCDIRNFTPMSEELQPREVVEMLNLYYSRMTAIVEKHNGAVNQFIGDEVFATFGAPVMSNHCEADAVLCAIDMVEAIPEINEELEARFGRNIVVGIGINSGPVVAGNMGSETKLAYSMVGDTVNTGKRIESLTKELKNGILISDRVYERCAHLIETTAWPLVEVKGKRDKLQVYEVNGRK